ncbi:MAG: hypothetical protein GYB64_00210 [Chloroflexi bacterium]|nr:hypothetical protein [Chloroflexota bacterium]
MTPYTITVHDELPAVVTAILAEFNMRDHYGEYDVALRNVLESIAEPLYLITDARNVNLGFADLVQGLADAAAGNEAITRHRMIRQILVVTANELINLGAKSLHQDQYGGQTVIVVRTLEDALDHIRAETTVY